MEQIAEVGAVLASSTSPGKRRSSSDKFGH